MRRIWFTIFAAMSGLIFVAFAILEVRGFGSIDRMDILFNVQPVIPTNAPPGYSSNHLTFQAIEFASTRSRLYMVKTGGDAPGTPSSISRFSVSSQNPGRSGSPWIGYHQNGAYISAIIPEPFVLLFAWIMPVFWIRQRLIKRHPPGHCANCGYDMRATPERCPECGKQDAKLSRVE